MHRSVYISFYIPTYNRSACLQDTILSVVQQASFDARTMEIVVCDDNSTDDTAVIVWELQKKYPNIQYIRNTTNLWIDGNIRKAFTVCSWKYIWLMWDDDLIYPDKVAVVLDAIQAYPDAYIFQLNYDHYDSTMTSCTKKNLLGCADKNTVYCTNLHTLYASTHYDIGTITYMWLVFRNDLEYINKIAIPTTYFPQSCIKSLLHNKPMVLIGESIIQYRTNHSDFATAHDRKGIKSHRKIWIIGYPIFVRFCYTNKVAVDYIKLAKPYIFILKRFFTLICVLIIRKLWLYDIILPRWRKSIFNIFRW